MEEVLISRPDPTMCLICIDFQRQRLTLTEARRAFSEWQESMDAEHAKEVEAMLTEAAEQQEAVQTRLHASRSLGSRRTD